MSEAGRITLLRFDQRRRWQEGDAVRVEAYLEQEPALRSDAEGLLDLIYNEIVLREATGDPPRLEEYLRRFPQFADQLRLQFQVHQALEGAPESGIGAPPGEEVSTSSSAAVVEPPWLPGYELLGELGRGGMGVVYKARQVELKRLVALKMILAGAHAGPRELTRFRKEAEAVARLRHPHIVQIYEIGEKDRLPYFSLELVDGPSLDQAAGGRPLPPVEGARVVEELAGAIHYAHQQGIIHRDLKPANVLLESPKSNVQSPTSKAQRPTSSVQRAKSEARLWTLDFGLWTPKITDFGLAKLLDAGDGRPSTEAFIGTPSYVAPEQAAGRTADVGPATDVYGLGAILYELLTGLPPFQGKTALDTLEQVRTRDPVLPTRVLANVPRELESICLKCLDKEPARRYASAHDLAEDLHRFLAGEPVRARPPSPWGRAWKWTRRRPAAAALLAVLPAAVLALLALNLWHADRLQQARGRYRHFIQRRDDALFYGTSGLVLGGDVSGDQSAARQAAREALSLVHLEAEDRTGPALDSYWSDREQAEVRAGCYQLLLVLGERGRAEALRPAGAVDHFLLGHEHYLRGEVAEAAAAFRNALRSQPDDFWSHFFLALCELRLGRPADAEPDLAACRGQRPGVIWTHLLSALVHERLAAFAAAEADYQQALALGPDPEAGYLLHANRGRLRLQQDRPDEAAADLTRAIALKPDHFYGYLALARVYQKQKKLEESDEQLGRMLRLRLPEAVQAEGHVEQGRNRYLGKNYPEAVVACEAALMALPRAADAHSLRARALLELGRYREAAAAFDRYLECGGKAVPDFYRGRGRARLQLGDYLGARDDYTRALETDPDAETYVHRGWAYFFADAWKPALRDFEEAVRRDPRLGEAHTGRGLARVLLGEYREAVADAEEALRRKPATPEMMHNTACIFALAVGKVEHDAGEADRPALAARYRDRALATLAASLTMLAPGERATFWRHKLFPDKALDSLRGCPGFKQLAEQYGAARPEQ
jgi:serine/threonine protein kinase/Tfp pilus assembly protein PilF